MNVLPGVIFLLRNRANALKVWGLAVLLVVCLAYANSFQNPFEFDDFHTITDNPSVRSLSNVPRFFTDATTFSVLPANRTYRPLVSLSLAVDYALGHGYGPLWFHVSTFVWLLVLLWVLWGLYVRLMDNAEASGANVWLALFAAAWFGLHPAMAETVNYIIQRGDVYCTLGCVGALAIYVARPAWRRFGLYLLPLAAALLSKPPATVFPALLLLYVFYFETDGFATGKRWKKSVVAALPAIAVTAGLMLLQSAMTPKTFAPSTISAADYRMVQPLVWLRYFGELFLPVHLNIDSDLGPMPTLTAAGAAGLGFVGMLGVAIAWASREKRRAPIAYGLAWFVVTQLPTSLYALSEVENDHRMFFSFVGLMLAVVWAGRMFYEWVAEAPVRERMRPVMVAGAVVVLGGYAWGTHARNAVWHSAESVWHDDTVKSPHNGRGLMIYGLALMGRGDYPGAKEYFTRALEYTPNYATLEVNLGVLYGAMGQPEEAEQHFRRAVVLAPDDDTSYSFYGRWLVEQGRRDEAIALFRRAIAVNPARPLPHSLLLQALREGNDVAALQQAARETLAVIPGDPEATTTMEHPVLTPRVPVSAADALVNASLAQYQAGQYAESVVSAKKALALNPKLATAWNNVGAAQGAMGEWDAAIASEKRALGIDPALQIAQNNLAAFVKSKAAGVVVSKTTMTAAQYVGESMTLNQQGKYEESIAAAKKALAIDPKSAEAWNNLAANYEAMKRWDPAIDAAKKAIALKPDFQLAKNNLAWSVSQKGAK